MKYTIYPNGFETHLDRPLYISDANSYEVKLFLAEDVHGTITVSAYKPGFDNPKLSTNEIHGKEAVCLLSTEQYDIPGDTRFECIVADVNGEILTTSSFVATVQSGGLNGEVAKNDLTELEALITLATKQVKECETTKKDVQKIADDTSKTANEFEGKIQNAVCNALTKAKESGEFDGKDGAPGKDGQDGKTPVRGVDFWTPDDEAKIKAYVAAQTEDLRQTDILHQEQIDAIFNELPRIDALETKIIYLTDTTYEFDFSTNHNNELRFMNEVTNISFNFSSGEYADNYSSCIRFNSGATPTAIDYTGSGILNWVGTDCTTVDGLFIFQPSASTHYDIVFDFNGTQFIGLVNGYVPSARNVVSE